MPSLPSQSLLRSLLEYDPETGKLTWKHRPASMFRDTEARSASSSANAWNAKNARKEAFTARSGDGYFHGKIGGNVYQAHRIIWKMVYGADPDFIDHVNLIKDDNRLSNLRNCSAAQNSWNYPKPRKSGIRYRGVARSKDSRKWVANISARGQRIYLGSFDSDIDAALAYDNAAVSLHGDFATLNFAALQKEPRP
ncbi:MAG: HNH endonuclease [Mesorhizobium sp.]